MGLVIGMDWSFCRFLIALSTAIRLMTTASSAIASRFTWRNMAQDKQVKKKATTVHLGSRLKISGCFRCYPKLPSKKKRRGWNAFCSQEGLVSACFRFSESERSMTFVTRSSSSARTQRSSLSPCHDLFPHEITLEVFFLVCLVIYRGLCIYVYYKGMKAASVWNIVSLISLQRLTQQHLKQHSWSTMKTLRTGNS